jgi:trigger factor
MTTKNPTKNYTNIKINSLPDREVEIIGEITAEKMSLMREKALKKFKEELEVDGFRKGNAPDSIVAQKVGEMRLLEEAAEIALSEEYPQILDEHNIDAIGRPEISLTKLGVGSPLEFKAKTALMPEIKLSDYKKSAGMENSKESNNSLVTVTDKEIDDVIKNIQQNITHQKMHQDGGLAKSSQDDSIAQSTEGGFRGEHDLPAQAEHSHAEIKDEDLPALDDEFAKMMGAKDVTELKSKIKENIAKEKEMKGKDKKRTAILEEIIKLSTINLPKIIVDGEMEKMLAQFKDDIARSGISYEEYLKHIKKTEDDLRKEWKDVAVKRAKSQVVLNEIAKAEGITPVEEEVKKEMEHILAHYKDAERFRVRMYVETFMTNELVFQFLEKQK